MRAGCQFSAGGPWVGHPWYRATFWHSEFILHYLLSVLPKSQIKSPEHEITDFGVSCCQHQLFTYACAKLCFYQILLKIKLISDAHKHKTIWSIIWFHSSWYYRHISNTVDRTCYSLYNQQKSCSLCMLMSSVHKNVNSLPTLTIYTLFGFSSGKIDRQF